jgi:hypothetical protein
MADTQKNKVDPEVIKQAIKDKGKFIKSTEPIRK